MPRTALRSAIVPPALFALLLALLTPVAPAYADDVADDRTVSHAPASQAKTLIPLEGISLPDIRVGAEGTLESLARTGDGTVVAPDSVLVTVADLNQVSGSISTSTLTLPAGHVVVGEATLSVTAATGPAGGAFSVTRSSGDLLVSTRDEPATDASFPFGSDVPVTWQFDALGRYEITIQVSITLADSDGVETIHRTPATAFTFAVGEVSETTTIALSGSETDVNEGDGVTLTAAVDPAAIGAVEFYDGEVLLGYTMLEPGETGSVASFLTDGLIAGIHEFTAVFVPTWSTDFGGSSSSVLTVTAGRAGDSATSVEPPEPSDETTTSPGTLGLDSESATTAAMEAGSSDADVLDSGDVRLAPRLVDGELELGLLDASGTEPVWRDAAETVLHIPNQDAQWPGEQVRVVAPSFLEQWRTVVPEGVVPWRTPGAAADWEAVPNDLRVGLDASLLKTSELAGDPELEFTSVGTPADEGLFRVYLSDFAQTGIASGQGYWGNDYAGTFVAPLSGSADGQPDASPLYVVGVLSDRQAAYCVTVTARVALPGGTVVEDSAVYAFVFGELPDGDVACEQPESGDGGGDGDAGSGSSDADVLDSGDVRLAPRLVDGELELGLLDASGTEPVWRDAAETVLHIPNQDTASPYTGLSSTEFWRYIYPEDALAYRTSGADLGSPNRLLNKLRISLYAGALPDSLSSATMQLRKVVSDTGGYFTSYRVGFDDTTRAYNDQFPLWDSRPTGSPRTTTVTKGLSTEQVPSGWLFSQPGRYCLTFSATLDGEEAFQTLTILVGDENDPSTVEGCAAPDSIDDDNTSLPDNGVAYIDQGHLDVGIEEHEGEIRLAIHSDATAESYAFEDAVVLGNTPHNRSVVRDGQEFIGLPVGSDYWRFNAANTNISYTPWPGFSSLETAFGSLEGTISWSVLDVSGPGNTPAPGDVAVFEDTSAAAGDPDGVWFSTATGLPASWSTVRAHDHVNWSFTEQGVYCIALKVSWQLSATGERQSQQDVFTVAVGTDIDVSTVQPCTRTGSSVPEAGALPDPSADSGAEATVADAGRVSLVPHLSESGTLEVSAGVQPSTNSGTSVIDADQVILSTTRVAAGTWIFGAWQAGSSPGLVWDGRYLDDERLTGDGTLLFGAASGPGTLTVSRPDIPQSTGGSAGSIATVYTSDQEAEPIALWSGWYEQRIQIRATEPGVYCLPATWEIDLSDGGTASVTKTLTLIFGDSTVSRDVELCAEGGTGNTPGDGDDDPDENLWDVPNGATTSTGAIIINDGHVDVASLLSDGLLDTKIKDDATGPTVYRDTESVVLQVLPESETTVPDSREFEFLGASTSRIWQVQETAQSGLLWPGWSTEAIPTDETLAGVNWKLKDIEAPGEVAVYANGATQVYFNTRDGITDADQFEIPKNTHAHANWAFSAEGVYCLAFERSTTLIAGNTPVTHDFVLTFAVGDVDVKSIDPAACFTEPSGEPEDSDTTPTDPGDLDDGNAGGIQVLTGENGFTAGQLVTVQIGADRAGDWVSVWLDDATWLGWAQVGSSGAIQVRLPAAAAVGSHVLVVEDADGALIGWDSLSVVAAFDDGSDDGDSGDSGDADTPATETVAATQCVAGATIVSAGHLDYSTRIVGGTVQSLIGDDSSGTKVYREPSGTILWLKPSSQVTLPSGYGAVGAAGATVWQVPQTQKLDLIWLGWSTESLNSGNTSSDVTWTVNSVDGPGTMKVYLTGSFGGVQQMVFNGTGSYTIDLGVHAHANWAFSAEGIYRISMTQTATLANGQASSDTETLTIVVGNVDPATAAVSGSGCGTISNALLLSDDVDATLQAAEQAAADAATAARGVLPGQGSDVQDGGFTDPFTALAQGNPVPVLLGILGALLLAGAAGTGVLWWRSRRRVVL